MTEREGEEGGDAARELVATGVEIAGAAAGGALGLIGGPPGVAAGAVGGVVVTRTLKRVANEIEERVFGPRERLRAAAAFTFAADAISARVMRGDEPRSDGFFDDVSGGRTPAEELLEGVLIRSAREHEEKKVRYIGRFYASLAFDASIDPGYANYILRVAERLTYGQLVCLALVVRGEYQELFMEKMRRAGIGSTSPESRPRALIQMMDLAQAGLIGVKQDDGSVVAPSATYGGGDVAALEVSKIGPTTIGRDIYRLMDMGQIPMAELTDLVHDIGP